MKLFSATLLLILSLHAFAQQKIYLCASGTTTSKFWSVDLNNCTYQAIGGPITTTFSDIAVTGDGRLWAVCGFNLYQVDTLTGAYTLAAVTPPIIGSNGLVELNDSMLLMSAGTDLYKVNVTSGAATLIGSTGYGSAGDLTWYDNDLYLTAANGILVRIQLNSTFSAITSSTAVNTISNPIPLCLGAITAPGIPNMIIGFSGTNAYRICPFDASYQLLCSSLIPLGPGEEIFGAAAHRLPVQDPLPEACHIVTSVDEFSSSSGFKISPNPAYDQFTIYPGHLERSTIIKVDINDTSGRLILSRQTNDQESTAFDISTLHSGIYFVNILDSEGNKLTRKLIKL